MAEFLEEEELIARIRAWLKEYGLMVVIGLALAIAIFGGYQYWTASSQEARHAGSQLYTQYVEGDADERAEVLAQIAEEQPASTYRSLMILKEAEQAVAAGDLGGARGHLLEAQEYSDYALVTDLITLRLAKVELGMGNAEQALTILNGVKSAGYRAAALEVKGDIHISRGEIEGAHLAYQEAKKNLREGERRPLLDLKVENTAPFKGEYVAIPKTLSDTLNEAAATLSEESEAPAADESTAQAEPTAAASEATND